MMQFIDKDMDKFDKNTPLIIKSSFKVRDGLLYSCQGGSDYDQGGEIDYADEGGGLGLFELQQS
jgi:hypothetical protein